MPAPEAKHAPARSNSWTQDPEGVKRNILAAAREAFVEHGFAGRAWMTSRRALRLPSG